MISDSELGRMLFARERQNGVHTIEAVAVDSSSDGTVTVIPSGIAAGVDASFQVPTQGGVNVGDTVMVTVENGAPINAVSSGSVDRVKETSDAAAALATSANENVAQVRQDIDDFIETAEATYATTEYVDEETGALSRSIATTYLSKSDANTTYATKSELTQESEAITAAVAADYVSKSDAETTYATKSELTVAEGNIMSNVSETYSTKTETATAKSEAISAAATDATNKANAAQSAAEATAAADATSKANAAQAAAEATAAADATAKANAVKAIADKNVKSTIQLWFTKANTTAPNKPTSKVTSTSTSGNAWRVVVPTYSATYPYYYYCYQYELADGTFAWSDVVYDRATTEAQATANTAAGNVSALETRVSTNETNIEQNTTAIALKANSSDVYTKTQTDGLITQEVSDRNAAISASASSITSSVSATYATKTALTDGLATKQPVGDYATKAEAADTESASGRSLTATDGAGLAMRSLTVYGESVQDGTPTPDAPVPVQVVEPINLIDWSDMPERTAAGVVWKGTPDGWVYASGTATANSYAQATPTQSALSLGYIAYCEPGTYTAHGDGVPFNVFSMDSTASGTAIRGYSVDAYTFTLTEARFIQLGLRVPNGTVTDKTYRVQLVRGTSVKPYVPYGAIGIGVAHDSTETVTPINLQGNVLASLPDGTKDVLHVEGGSAWIEKNTKSLTIASTDGWTKSGSATNGYYKSIASLSSGLKQNTKNGVMCEIATAVDNVNTYFQTTNAVYIDSSLSANLDASVVGSTLADYKTWLGSNPFEVILALSAPETIDLGSVTLPQISTGDTVRVIAEVTPVIDGEWWRDRAVAEVAQGASDAALANANSIESLKVSTSTQIEQSARDVTATIRSEITETNTTLDGIVERVSTIEKSVRIDDSGVTIAASDSPITANLDNTGLTFSAGDTPVLTLNAETSTAEAERVSIGNYQWREMGENAIALVWIGA